MRVYSIKRGYNTNSSFTHNIIVNERVYFMGMFNF